MTLLLGVLAIASIGLLLALWRQRRTLASLRATVARHAAVAGTAVSPVTERERIYADLHDDLGAKLLQLVYQASTPQQADLARSVLQDLRDVVSRSRGDGGTLDDVLADIRNEATQRLAAVGTALSWQQPDALPDAPLPAERALHLYRIVREAISNALRHAPARRLRMRIRIAGERLDIELTDDGDGGPPAAVADGRGMQSMRSRADQLQGEIAWLPGTEGGTKVLLSMPLHG